MPVQPPFQRWQRDSSTGDCGMPHQIGPPREPDRRNQGDLGSLAPFEPLAKPAVNAAIHDDADMTDNVGVPNWPGVR